MNETHPFDALATPVLHVGPDQRVSWINPAGGSWLGLGLRRIVGHSVNLLAGRDSDLAALCERAREKPDGVRAQPEGSAVFGASLALHGEITTSEGAGQSACSSSRQTLRSVVHGQRRWCMYDPASASEPCSKSS